MRQKTLSRLLSKFLRENLPLICVPSAFPLFSKQKWDEEDFEGEMEEDYDDDLGEDSLPTGREAVAPGKGILLLPHRQLHPHSQLLKARPSLEQEPRAPVPHPHAAHSQLGGQDHGDWTYEEQFRQVGGREGGREGDH